MTGGGHGTPRLVLPLVWLLILGLCFWVILRTRARPPEKDQRVGLLILDLQVRYLVGGASLLNDKQGLYRQGRGLLDRGSFAQRLRFVVLAGALVSPRESLHQLDTLRELARTSEFPPNDSERLLADTLEQLYRDGADTLTDDQIDRIRDQLGWSGQLALATGPEGANQRLLQQSVWTAKVALSLLSLATGAIGLGLLILLVLGIWWWQGRLQDQWYAPSASHGIYLETFALWMLYYILGSLGLRQIWLGSFALMASSLLMLSSLVVLLWPRVRGLSWQQIRREIGLGSGRFVLAEAFLGLAVYIATLPILLIMLMIQSRLLGLFTRPSMASDPLAPIVIPNHPVIESLLQGNLWVQIQVILAASIVAPLVEEIVFRGLLYRHLREGSQSWGRFFSVLWSALINGLLFAAVHPQGLVAIPFLTILALAFSLVREWRGCLIPCWIGHAINNSLLTISILLLTAR